MIVEIILMKLDVLGLELSEEELKKVTNSLVGQKAKEYPSGRVRGEVIAAYYDKKTNSIVGGIDLLGNIKDKDYRDHCASFYLNE